MKICKWKKPDGHCEMNDVKCTASCWRMIQAEFPMYIIQQGEDLFA